MHEITTTQDSRTCVRGEWALVKCKNPAIGEISVTPQSRGVRVLHVSSKNTIGSAVIEFAQ